ncbi:hypothetical protein [Polyangium jinanense]|uniref:Uncharacterized protein n=1 Tax=Polyangium jinanense TaxID=2829994 RepID=A0A9X3X6J0_9BACT|nr:hypothetical protein [Polyangium jinanense]MDC3955679.1 hypothetical protein [Polyangium jinanense]MDC3982321.1 hypothetical protein [Polyangium jinanense]
MRLRSPSFLLLTALSLLVAPACGPDAETPPTIAPVRPEPPAENDPAFTVTGVPRYVLAGDGLTVPTKAFQINVTAPKDIVDIDAWIDGAAEPVPLVFNGNQSEGEIGTLDLPIGNHSFMLSVRGSKDAFFRAEFVKGHALYMVISTDWDFSDVDDRVLDHHTELHTAHPELKITHLIGPYTFTDPAIPQQRRDDLVSWAQGMRSTYGDEIGLHIHPYCNFVEAAGVACKTSPSVADPAGDPTGYTVRLGAYSREEWKTLFGKANEIWEQVGFGKPTSFRAGAWTLETHVAQALVDTGFLVDSSANNWKLMEEWIGYDIYEFNKTQWAPIGDTSQPYRPTEDSIVAGGKGPELGLLEVPDNGCMVDYWAVEEMENIFDANWSGGALTAPTQVSTGFHPATTQYYSPNEFERLDAFFTYVDQFLASKHEGPVIYINMTDATNVW